MTRLRTVAALIAIGLLCAPASFTPTTKADEAKPLRALLITGGGYHDYKKQKVILSEGISARANVVWDIVLENPKRGALPEVFKKKDWAKGYDVIVHNECFASYANTEVIDAIVQAHVDNKVGVVAIHCAFHTFRATKTKSWDNLLGVQSYRHGPKFPITIKNLKPDHPVMKGFPATYKTPQGELYHTKAIPNSVPLGMGSKDGEVNTNQMCIWVNEYKGLRVFCTTLGHHNVTMEQPEYLDLVARGLLWTCHKLNDDGTPMKGYAGTGVKKAAAK